MFKMLQGTSDLEVHHEFLCTQVQQLAALYSMSLINKTEAIDGLRGLHYSAIYWSEARTWVDSSNKLTWLIEPIIEILPNAKFINLVRDGRKVASSFVRKLRDEIYDDESVAVMIEWLADRTQIPMPPPEKKYWWNVPLGSMPMASEFQSFSQFERVVYHWVEANRVARTDLAKYVPASQQLTLKLEDLIASQEILTEVCSFIGVAYDHSYWAALQRPENVIYPMDVLLTKSQTEQFTNLAAETMSFLGYDINSREYSVDYK